MPRQDQDERERERERGNRLLHGEEYLRKTKTKTDNPKLGTSAYTHTFENIQTTSHNRQLAPRYTRVRMHTEQAVGSTITEGREMGGGERLSTRMLEGARGERNGRRSGRVKWVEGKEGGDRW